MIKGDVILSLAARDNGIVLHKTVLLSNKHGSCMHIIICISYTWPTALSGLVHRKSIYTSAL